MSKRTSKAILGALIGVLSLCSVWNIHAEDVSYLQVGPFGTLNNTDNSIVIPNTKAQDLLNIDIAPQGGSVRKRKGYATAQTLTISTSPVHGVHYFYDSNGSDVALYFNDTNLSASVSGASVSNIFTNGPNGATWQCIDSQGFAYCANTTRSAIIKTNGVTSSNLAGFTSTGTMVAVTPERLVQAGLSSAPNDIVFSKANDFTTWTIGTEATDPISFTITAPGPKITHITYAFDRIVWFKSTSFGYIMIGNQPAFSDWQVVTVDPNLGTLDNTSVYRDGYLYFRGQDGHIYSFDGTQMKKLTRDIQDTISASQFRISNSWSQTTQEDFELGVSTPTGFVSSTITINAISLGTATAIAPFVDTSSTDFVAGTYTNISTSPNLGSINLAYTSELILSSVTLASNDAICDSCGANSKAFFSTATNAVGTSVTLRLVKLGSPGDYIVRILTDNSLSPGTFISSATLSASSLVANSTTNINISIISTKLPVGTTFWVQIQSGGTCNSSNVIRWLGLNYVGTPNTTNLCGGAATNSLFGLATFGRQFIKSGQFFSQPFDMGFTTNTWIWDWSIFNASFTIPFNSTLSYFTQTSSSPTGGFTSFVDVSTGNSPVSPVQRYIRYEASFNTEDASTSPVVGMVSIATSNRLRPGGTFYSQVHNSPNLNAWDSFDATIINSTNAHSFSMRSATNSFTVLSSTPSWTSISNGGIPSISTGTYFQFKDTIITTTTAYGNPTLTDFTQNWFEGSASDKSYGVYFRDAIWWSLTSGAGATINNKILYYDMNNDGMTLYDIPSNGFYVRNESLYFGSTSEGKIFKYGDVDNDNGSAINAYWKSKDYVMGNPFQDKELVNISIAGKSVSNSSMTVTYEIDASTSTSYTVPFASSDGYIKSNKNLSFGKVGQTFNIQFGNNAADQSFEIFGIQAGYRVKSWKPE